MTAVDEALHKIREDRIRAETRAAVEAELDAKVEAKIADLCGQYQRTGYDFALDYARFLWANFARGGSIHPDKRVKEKVVG
jgi:hypothetical protein